MMEKLSEAIAGALTYRNDINKLGNNVKATAMIILLCDKIIDSGKYNMNGIKFSQSM